jgi:hypothetical protein
VPNILGVIQERARHDPPGSNVLLATAGKIAFSRAIDGSEEPKGGLHPRIDVERPLGCIVPAVGNGCLALLGITRASRSDTVEALRSKVPPEVWP